MRIRGISGYAGRTIPSLYVQDAILKPAITRRATLEDADDAAEVCQEEQAKAEARLEGHERAPQNTTRSGAGWA